MECHTVCCKCTSMYNTTPTAPITDFRNYMAFIKSDSPAAFAKQMGQSSSQKPGHIFLTLTALEMPVHSYKKTQNASDTHTKKG